MQLTANSQKAATAKSIYILFTCPNLRFFFLNGLFSFREHFIKLHLLLQNDTFQFFQLSFKQALV